MTDGCAKAHTVHALLFSALPHRTDESLKKAAGLLLTDGDFQDQKPVLLAIQAAMAAIENGVGAAEGDNLLIQARREALSRVQRCSSETPS